MPKNVITDTTANEQSDSSDTALIAKAAIGFVAGFVAVNVIRKASYAYTTRVKRRVSREYIKRMRENPYVP